MKLAYVTGNLGKFEEASLILHPVALERVELDLPELQGPAEMILRHKAAAASAALRRPLIVEDVSLHLAALGGFPGPYIKDFLHAVGEDGLWKLCERMQNFSCDTTCFAAYVAPGQEPVVVQGRLQGSIVPPRGSLKHGKVSYNSCFLPDGYRQTFGEMSMEEHALMSHRFQALRQIKNILCGPSLS